MVSFDPATDPTGDGSDPDDFRRFALVVGGRLDLDLSAAAPESLLHDDLGLDSIAMAEMVLLLADHGVVLPDDLVAELRTLGDLHHYARVVSPVGPVIALSVSELVPGTGAVG